jgi:hypothetical protein
MMKADVKSVKDGGSKWGARDAKKGPVAWCNQECAELSRW